MHPLLTILAATATTTAKKSKSSSSTITFLIILVVFFGVYMLFIRPRSQRMKQQQSTARTLSIGDTVVSAGGIQGTVVALDTDVAEVEVAPGVVLTFLRRSINRADGSRGGNPRADNSGNGAPRQNSSGPPAEDWSVHQEQLDAPPTQSHPLDADSATGLDHDSEAGQRDQSGDPPDQHP